MRLGHVFFGAKVGVVDGRILAGVVLLASQFSIVQATSIAERAGSIRSTSPLGSFGAVAAVASSRRCSTSATFLGIRTREAVLHVVFVGSGGHDRFGVCLLLLALLRGLLVVGQLLCHDDVPNFGQGVQLKTRLGHHVFDLDQARKSGRSWARTHGLVEAVPVATCKVRHDTTRLSDLHHS